MITIALAALLILQEPSVPELLRRLETGDLDVRDKAESDLVARGSSALKEVEAALAAATDAEFRLRLNRAFRKLRLADLVARMPEQFSDSFRNLAPGLMEALKSPEPGVLIEALAVTTGMAWHWEDRPTNRGDRKPSKEIIRPVAAEISRADAVEIIRLALRAIPEAPLTAPWAAVHRSVHHAIQPARPEDRRSLVEELLHLRGDPECRNALVKMAVHGRSPEDLPGLLSILDAEDPELTKRALEGLPYVSPGPHAVEFEKRLANFKPPLRRWLLYPLKAAEDRRFMKTFEEYLHGPEADERTICLEALRRLAPETLPAHYLAWVRSDDPPRVLAGLQFSLGNPRNPLTPSAEMQAEARRHLETAKTDPIRLAALAVLKRAPAEKVRALIVELLADPRPHVHSIAFAEAAKLKGDDIRAALEKLADSTNELSSLEALSILLTWETPPSIDRIRAHLKSPDPKVRLRAMAVLDAHSTEKAREDLVPLLDDPDPKVRVDALQRLSWRAKGLEEQIRRFLESKDDYTVLVATRALAGLGDRSCLPAIRKGLNSRRFSDYLPCFISLVEPSWTPVLACTFRIPAKDPKVKDVVEGVREALKDRRIEVRYELPENKLEQKINVPGVSEKGWPLGWVRSMITGSGYFFDGKTLTIMPDAEATKKWRDWAAAK
jgi:HEAT repeat protein